MDYIIPCEIYAKFATLALTSDDPDWRCIRIERVSGKLFVIASNRRVTAVQHIGSVSEPDGSITILANAALIKQCETEAQFHGTLAIASIEALKIVTAKTIMGYNYPGSIGVFDDKTKLAQWRDLMPEKQPSKNKGAMYWNVRRINQLAATAPSGDFVFSEFIDVAQPVLVRSPIDANWFGLFMPSAVSGDWLPATLPAWVKL